jgi:hypothetical protein
MINEILITLNLILLIAILIFILMKASSKKSENFEVIKEIKTQVLDNEEKKLKPSVIEINDYVGAPNSKKYHKAECRLVKQIKEPEYGSKKDFVKRGYRPCGVCCLED